ncbi:DUF4123 domain-containing protein [Providencia rettgeri]|uniref:DUF4123 domain-containing protein n=1 Tax=Providencia TaxID=586 RepID=UPI001CFD969D|nr:DUF4123 domain-containing protein [Providencia rettgeri]EIU7556877.1 DUF4123 domain-containing protein [Providencia rettgeri]MCB4839221.1 DUF4123 domain-containing protein [Providencia rettgeri]HEM8305098.1 DUF4123 domain-containing protein [Providencia rettgeri]
MENLVQAANQSQNNIYLLIEGGAFAEQTIEPFQQKNPRSLYSLYQHPQLIEAKWVGPWLYQVKNNAELAAEMAQFQQVVTVIFSSLELKPLAMQLAWGCTLVKPDLETIVSRFYIHAVMPVLAHCQKEDWHYYLFSGTTTWWHQTLSGWQPTDITTKAQPKTHDRTVYLDESTWQQIDDDPEVKSILAQWQQMPMSQHFPPCIQRQKVIQTLKKAEKAGLTESDDRTTYALLYLEGYQSLLTQLLDAPYIENIQQGKYSLAHAIKEFQRKNKAVI